MWFGVLIMWGYRSPSHHRAGLLFFGGGDHRNMHHAGEVFVICSSLPTGFPFRLESCSLHQEWMLSTREMVVVYTKCDITITPLPATQGYRLGRGTLNRQAIIHSKHGQVVTQAESGMPCPSHAMPCTSASLMQRQACQHQCCGSESGSTGSTCFWAPWIRILLSLSKNSKKNLDFYCFVTSF